MKILRWLHLVPMALCLVFANITAAQADPVQVVSNPIPITTSAAAETAISELLDGSAVSVVPGSVQIYGDVKSFTSANSGPGLEIDNGLMISAKSPTAVTSETSLEAAEIVAFMNNILTAALVPDLVTNFSAVKLNVTNSSYLGVEFLFLSTEYEYDAFDFAMIAVDGVNYGFLQTESNGLQLIRVHPSGELTDIDAFDEDYFIDTDQIVSGATTQTIFAQFDATKTINEILIAVSNTSDSIFPSYLLFNFKPTPMLPTVFAFTPSIQPELTQTGQFLTCRPGKFEFASSEIKMNSIVYTLMIDNQPVSELVIDGDQAIAKHTLNSFKQSVLGVASAEMAVWDMTGQTVKNASCNVTVYKHGSSSNLSSNLISAG